VWKSGKREIRSKNEGKIHEKSKKKRHFVGMTSEKTGNVIDLSLKCRCLSYFFRTGMTSLQGLLKSFPQVVEKSVEKSDPSVGKNEKVFLYKGIFRVSAGCGKSSENPPKSL